MAKQSNPLDQKQLKRLVRSHEYARKQMRPFREAALAGVRQMTGRWYEDETREKVPLGYIELAVNIYTRLIAARVPQVLITSDNRRLRHGADAFQVAMNHLLKEIEFGTTLDEAVLAAMFGDGIVKVGVTTPQLGEVFGYSHDAGQPFADNIVLDNWAHDMTVKRWEQCQWMSDRYTVDTKAGSDAFSRELDPSIRNPNNEDGDEKLEAAASRMNGNDDVWFAPVTEVWDFWIPQEQLVVTLECEPNGRPRDTEPPLQVVEWGGPERGMYHRLAFGRVPGNIQSLPPVAIIMDLHELANKLFRKSGRQAERQKDNTVYQGEQQDDARRLNAANDGDLIPFNGPVSGVQKVRSGGADAATMAMGLQIKDTIFTHAGNLDALGGLSPQANTLGQDELLSGAASRRVERMQEQGEKFTLGIVEDLGDWVFYDPLYDPPLTKPVEGTRSVVTVSFAPERREGDFLDYNFQFVPFSMQSRSPSQRLQGIMGVWERVLLPMLPYLVEQGKVPDIDTILELHARYMDQPELRDIMLNFQPPNGEPGVVRPSGSDGPRQAPVTTRRSVRVNRPGATRQGRDDVMARLLMGSNSQPAENAALAGGIG